MKFIPLDESYQHGHYAQVGDRRVEVLRSYPDDWFIYAQINGRVCKSRSERRMSYSDAMRDARDFLNRKITWECWPMSTFYVRP